ncbi:MAG: 30S ribosomal protein S3 [Firmicutes bacterium]|nr:30S ribosomal protein S3 [Bacillota bacterium]
MGQKVHPYGLRLGINKDWLARWFAGKEYADLLHEDLAIRKQVLKRMRNAGISQIEIERAGNRIKIGIHTAKPGIVIGRGGVEVDNLRQQLEKTTGKQVAINILEIKTPELDAQLVAEGIASQLERRVAFRRAMKQAITRAMRSGAGGIKIQCKGRLGGAEIARAEWFREGRIPLQTLRADVDFGLAEAFTTYGQIGVKAWIYKRDLMPKARKKVGGSGANAKAG